MTVNASGWLEGKTISAHKGGWIDIVGEHGELTLFYHDNTRSERAAAATSLRSLRKACDDAIARLEGNE